MLRQLAASRCLLLSQSLSAKNDCLFFCQALGQKNISSFFASENHLKVKHFCFVSINCMQCIDCIDCIPWLGSSSWWFDCVWILSFSRPLIVGHQQQSVHIFPHKMNFVLHLGCAIVREVLCCQLGLCNCPTCVQRWKRRCDQAGFPTEEELPPGPGKPPAFLSRAHPLCAGDARQSDQT